MMGCVEIEIIGKMVNWFSVRFFEAVRFYFLMESIRNYWSFEPSNTG